MLFAAACYNAAFAIFHLLFWRIFRWPESLTASGPLNAGITQVLNLCLTFVFVSLAGALFAAWAAGYEGQALTALLMAAAAFWAFRALLQPVYFPMSHPVSLLLLLIFIAGALIHGLAASGF